MPRAVSSILVGIVAFFVSYIIIIFAIASGAEHEYPHTSSMAGFAATIYGFPYAVACGLLGIGLDLWRTGRKKRVQSNTP
jgi:MFS family permease